MAIKVNGTTVIDDSRNATFTGATISGTTDFTSTDSLSVPSGTTAERPSSPSAGYIRYNTDENDFELYDGTSWKEIGSGEIEKASLTKSFVANEQTSLNLSIPTPVASVSVTKEIPQIELANNDWVVESNASNYSIHDTAYDTTLAPSNSTGNGTFVLGSGSFTEEDVGKRIVGNGGEAVLLSSDGSYGLITVFNDTSDISSGDWSMFALDANNEKLLLSSFFSAEGYNNYTINNGSYIGEGGDSGSFTISVKPDGTIIYLSGYRSPLLRQYDLSTPFDITSAVYSNKFLDVEPVQGGGRTVEGTRFRSDGYLLYIVDRESNKIFQYTLSTPWDISTANYSGYFFDVSDITSEGDKGVVFKDDGTKMIVSSAADNRVYEFNLSTSWDVSTASYSGNSLSLSTIGGGGNDIDSTGDGTQLFVLDRDDAVYKFNLSTPWDITSASYTGDSLNISTATSDGVKLDVVNEYIFIADYQGNATQYSVDATFTGPGETSYITLADQYTTAITSSSIDSEFWSDINSMVADDNPGNGVIYYAISTDDRTTWKILDYNESAERSIVRNNSDTWQINNASNYESETWIDSTINDEFSALEEAVDINVAQSNVSYSIKEGSYTNTSFDVSAEDTSPLGMFFKPDGTKMYVAGNTNNSIFEYDLSTAWDITTLNYSNTSFNVSTEDSTPEDVFFKPDGTKMYVAGNTNNSIFEYDLSTAWDISTASYSGNSFNVFFQDSAISGIFFKPDGLKLYITGTSTDCVYEYNILTAWDISTVDYSNKFFDMSTLQAAPEDLFFRPDGHKLYVIGASGDSVYEYDLTAAWDISTASYSRDSLDISSEETSPQGLSFKPDGTKLYVIGASGDSVYEYDTVGTTSANRMNRAMLNSISDTNHFNPGNSLDLAITFYAPLNSGILPESKGVSINYDANTINQLAVIGADYEYDQPDDSIVRVKSLNSDNLRIRVI